MPRTVVSPLLAKGDFFRAEVLRGDARTMKVSQGVEEVLVAPVPEAPGDPELGAAEVAVLPDRGPLQFAVESVHQIRR